MYDKFFTVQYWEPVQECDACEAENRTKARFKKILLRSPCRLKGKILHPPPCALDAVVRFVG